MNTTLSTNHSSHAALAPAAIRSRWATAATFGANGIVAGSFASRIPALKTTLSLSESGLGRLLFAGAVSSLLTLQIAGRLTGRFGTRRASLDGAAVACSGLALLALARSWPLAAVGLAVWGAGVSVLDVAMNSQAVFAEQAYRRPIMSSFHAVFSGGALIGAAIGGLCAARGFGQPSQYLVTAIAIGIVLVVATSSMVPDGVLADLIGPRTEEVSPRRPERRRGSGLERRTVLVFGTIAFAGMLSEGAAADWSGVHLRDTLGWTEGAAAQGFIAFQVFMTLGRIMGDRVVGALGARRTLLASAVVSAVGFGAGLASRSGWPYVAGVALLGIGLAVIVPVVFSTAAAEAGDAGRAIARVSTLGYAGFLVGPPVIGQLAQWTSTTVALAFLPVLAVAVVVITTLFVHPVSVPRAEESSP